MKFHSLMSGWSGVTLVQFIQSAVAQLPKQEKITLVLGKQQQVNYHKKIFTN